MEQPGRICLHVFLGPYDLAIAGIGCLDGTRPPSGSSWATVAWPLEALGRLRRHSSVSAGRGPAYALRHERVLQRCYLFIWHF